MQEGDCFTRDMGYSAAEFFRILPAAARGYELTVTGHRAVLSKPGGRQRLTLTVTPLPDRRLAMMRLPHAEARFAFTGFSAAERERFMRDFDKSYQRGGG